MARPRYFVKLRPGQSVEKGLKILKKKYLRDGFFKELRSKQYFEKGSERKIRKAKEMRINSFKKKKLRERNI